MFEIAVPRTASRKNLPSVCVVSGATEGIYFMPVEFNYYEAVKGETRPVPRTVKLVLPFTKAAHGSFRTRRQLVRVAAGLGFLAAAAFGVAGAPPDLVGEFGSRPHKLFGAAIIVGYFLVALAVRQTLLAIGWLSFGPIFQRAAADGRVVLLIPSIAAAKAFWEAFGPVE